MVARNPQNKAAIKTTFYGSRFQWCKCISFFLFSFKSAEAFYHPPTAFQSRAEVKHLCDTTDRYMLQEIKRTRLLLQTKGNTKLTFRICQVVPKRFQTPTKKVEVHSITQANYLMSGESLYPKLSKFKQNIKKQSNIKERFNFLLRSTSGMEMFVDMYPLKQGEDQVFIKLYF